MILSRSLQAICLMLLCALSLVVSPTWAQTISNTAKAQWSEQGRGHSISSNTVSFPVSQNPIAIETFVAGQAGEGIDLLAPSCGISGSSQAGGRSGLHVNVTPASTLKTGNLLYFRISAPAANSNPGAIDRIAAVLTSASGDREQLTVYETEANSGAFVGFIRTVGVPPAPTHGDCLLSAGADEQVVISASATDSSAVLATAAVNVLADPYGVVFDSENGTLINGARVSLVDAASGTPAEVFAADGVTRWPSTMISGQAVTDASGTVHPMQPGEYRFPLAALGQYRIIVDPPASYAAPSAAAPALMAHLRRPDGAPMQIVPASYGKPLSLVSLEPVRVDIPLDPSLSAVTAVKTASRQTARPGEVIFYTITLRNPDERHAKNGVTVVDTASATLRLRSDSIHVDGKPAGDLVRTSADGRVLTVNAGMIDPGASRTISYAMVVRADAAPGSAVNSVVVSDDRDRSSRAAVAVRISREDIASRMTLIGRITDGACGTERGNPIAGVRVVLEDGSFAITDADGRYHFEGLVPGSHVVQAVGATLPEGSRFVDCADSTRSAGRANSRFVTGQGGSLVVANFRADVPQGSQLTAGDAGKPDPEAAAAEERTAAGADVDWLAMGDGPPEFLFPAIDHNPRAPAVRVVIRHRADQTVELKVDGAGVDPVSFEGTRQAPGGKFAVSIWRGVPLDRENTRLDATVHGAQGEVAAQLSRVVHFSQAPARIELVSAASRLVADGRTRPVLALRVLDREGRPVRAGLTGEFQLSAPYESAEALDAMQQRALTGQGRSAPRWHVKGDDGMAYVELAPTMASGKLLAQFNLSDGQTRRRIELEAWIVPGDQPWTVVGLGEATAGARSVADAMQRSGQFDSDLGDDARVAFYAKGPVADGVLLTAAYDSAKQRDDQELLGAIVPQAYYTVFADMSDRRQDAASRDKLYARIEGEGFYALYGDFEAGFDQTQLARYQRTATGLKGEVTRGPLHVQAFGAKISSSHRRDEFQGAGISGPYRLSSRAYVAGSEVVALEVRDRFRSELVVNRRVLARFIDYDIDLLSGTITFKQPVLSRDSDLNPQFIVISYDVAGASDQGEINAGVRADLTMAEGRLRIGASAVSEQNDAATARKTLTAVDIRAQLGRDTELRAEIGASFGQGPEDLAWLVEAEHHGRNLDLLAYARHADRNFGLGQTSGAELGREKYGLDARYRVNDLLSVTASAWRDQSLDDEARRTAVRLGANWHGKNTDARLGLALMRDRLADGRSANSTVLEGGVTQRLLDNRLELSASSSIALDQTESIDLPARHRFTARYALTSDIRLVGTYELAEGEAISARTAQAGVEISPWSGARVNTAMGQQIGELGKRSYAAYGLAQSIPVSSALTIDASVDGNRTLSGFDRDALVNSEHPAASGGTIGENGTIAEDFTAITLGGTWRAGRWSATMRGEYRDGELADRKGVTLGAIRQLGEGSMLGAGFTWTRATATQGSSSEVIDGSIAAAWRPANDDLAMLAKLQFRGDRIEGAIAGEAGPAGRGALTITGNGRSDRLIASLSGNWTPQGRDDDRFVQRSEAALFAAVRYNFDSVEGFDLAGTTLLGGLDLRYGISPRLELGMSGTVRANLSDKTTAFAVGPQIGVTPAKDLLLILGYNITGFRDPDFSAARLTEKGLFVSVRFKFDDGILGLAGLGKSR